SMQRMGLRTRVSDNAFSLDGMKYEAGTVLIPVENQGKTADEVYEIVRQAAEMSGAVVVGVSTGLTPSGPDLGSRGFSTLQQPEVLLLTGPGVRSYDVGEAWHVLDTRYEMVVSKAEPSELGTMDLSRYNVVVLADGRYDAISSRGKEKLQDWVRRGGTLIGMQGALGWMNRNNFGSVNFVSNPAQIGGEHRPYNMLSRDRGGSVVGGAIFATHLDLSHPLAYGYRRDQLPVFRAGTQLMEVADNPYATPFKYTDQPLMSGYINDANLENLRNKAAVVVSGQGSGAVIYMADNPNFRAFWYGTNKMFANSIFFGSVISSASFER
ncbi:MAG: zinc carboxypeptidase, partial [Saprospiraceae bacterium]|nr:zinc carboxypeptidase [Saprospiraceae bacterium]